MNVTDMKKQSLLQKMMPISIYISISISNSISKFSFFFKPRNGENPKKDEKRKRKEPFLFHFYQPLSFPFGFFTLSQISFLLFFFLLLSMENGKKKVLFPPNNKKEKFTRKKRKTNLALVANFGELIFRMSYEFLFYSDDKKQQDKITKTLLSSNGTKFCFLLFCV